MQKVLFQGAHNQNGSGKISNGYRENQVGNSSLGVCYLNSALENTHPGMNLLAGLIKNNKGATHSDNGGFENITEIFP